MLQRFLLLWLVLSSLLAYFWPQVWSGSFDPFVAVKDVGALSPLIQVTMFCIGCLLPRDEVTQVFRKWPTVFGGTAIQYTAMPALAFLACQVFPLDEAAKIGVVFVGCVPGAMASNILTLAARGNVSYSVSLTTAATLLSPLAVPTALWLILGDKHLVDPVAEGIKLVSLVVGPVVAGHLLCRFYERAAKVMQKLAPSIANLAILIVIAVVVGDNRSRLGHVTVYLLAALLCVNLLGYAAGYGGGRLLKLPEQMRRALTLEVGMQNAGLGTVMAVNMFADQPAVAIPTAAYTFGCMLTGTILAQWWARKGSDSEPVESVTA